MTPWVTIPAVLVQGRYQLLVFIRSNKLPKWFTQYQKANRVITGVVALPSANAALGREGLCMCVKGPEPLTDTP